MIKTRKFHLVGGAGKGSAQACDEFVVALPPSYKAFISMFENAKLYRKGSSYLVEVFSPPEFAEFGEDRDLLYFGRTDSSLAYFKMSLLVPGAESPVFEWHHNLGLRKGPASFEEWLKRRCAAARKRFSSNEWRNILGGPPLFDKRERAIIEARKRISWRVIGIAPNGDLQFEVHNGSDMVLPFLSIGIRGKRGKVDGGVWLPIASVAPGSTQIIEKSCYKDLLKPEDVEVFSKPDPEPEDRERYWEFKQ